MTASAHAWLGDALAPLLPTFPGLTRVLEWTCGLPYALTDLVGVELEPAAPHAPAALHVRVVPEQVALLARPDVAARWPRDVADAPSRLAEAVADGFGLREQGFVVDAVGDGTHAPAALYSGIGGDVAAGTATRALDLLGAPPATCALLQSHAALARASHVGVMTGRRGTPARLVLPENGLDDELWHALATLPGADADTLVAARAFVEQHSHVRRCYLDVDLLDGHLGPWVGVEVKSAAEQMLDPDVLAMLRAWEGARYLAATGGPASGHDLAGLLAGKDLARETRWLSHVKVTFGDGAEMRRKVYLGVDRRPVRVRSPQAGRDE